MQDKFYYIVWSETSSLKYVLFLILIQIQVLHIL